MVEVSSTILINGLLSTKWSVTIFLRRHIKFCSQHYACWWCSSQRRSAILWHPYNYDKNFGMFLIRWEILVFNTHCPVHPLSNRLNTYTSFGRLSSVWVAKTSFVDHYSGFIMSAMASQITSLTIVYSTVCSGADHKKHQSSASLASVRGIHRWPVNSPHKGPVTRKMFPFDDVIMFSVCASLLYRVT